MNKFAKETINTYSKKNSILASKHTQRGLQVTLNFNIVGTKVTKNSLMTSTIYSVSYGIKKCIRCPTQEKRKEERTKTKGSKKYILACQQLKVIYFPFFFFFLSNLLYFLILLIHAMNSYYHFFFLFLFFLNMTMLKCYFFSFIYEIFLCISNQVIPPQCGSLRVGVL